MTRTLVIAGVVYTLPSSVTDGYALTVSTSTRAVTLTALPAGPRLVCNWYASQATNLVISSLGTGPTALGTNLTRCYDLTKYTRFRLSGVVNVAGSTGSTLRLQRSTDGSSWNDAQDSGTGADLAFDALGMVVGAWGTLHSGALIESCYLRIAGYGGDTTKSPGVRMADIEFK